MRSQIKRHADREESAAEYMAMVEFQTWQSPAALHKKAAHIVPSRDTHLPRQHLGTTPLGCDADFTVGLDHRGAIMR